MSASREKKQRQGAGPSEKAVQTQKEQAARKQKTIIYSVIGAVAAVLVIALLVWNSGFFQSRATAATVGNTSLTAGELSYYYYSMRSEYAAYASLFGYSFDSSKADSEQYQNEAEGVTWRDYFLDSALETAQQYIALAGEAPNWGVTEADIQDDLNDQIASMKSSAASSGYSYAAYLRAVYGPYMTEGIYKAETARSLLASRVFNNKSTELTESYSQADLDSFYGEHADSLDTIEYSYLYFTPEAVETTDADGNELDAETLDTLRADALADARAQADEALEEYGDGEEISHLIEHYAPYSSADHTTTVGTSGINSVYSEELLALKEGEAALVENSDSGYYVVIFHGRYLDQTPTLDVRHILVMPEAEAGTVPTDPAWAAASDKADSILAEYEAGSRTDEAFAALANQYSDDAGSNTTGGLYQRISPTSNYVTEFMDWIFTDGRQIGDTGIVQHIASDPSNGYYGYHIMYLAGENEPVWMGTARDSMADTALDEWILELADNYAASLADGSGSVGS